MNLNKSIEQYKHDEVYREKIDIATSSIDNCFIARPVSQRIYHFINNKISIPLYNNSEWPCKFININRGYDLSKPQEIRDYNRLNEDQMGKFLKGSQITRAIRHPACKKYLDKHVNIPTKDYQTKLTYFRLNVNQPLYFKNNRLIDLKKFQNKKYIKTFNDFNANPEEFLKSWFLGSDQTLTAHIKLIKNIQDYIDTQCLLCIDLPKNASLRQRVYHLVYKKTELPPCKHCGKGVTNFNDFLKTYPQTCSMACNNKCVEIIEKRLRNNETNNGGYKTNIGKNEQQLLDVYEEKTKNKLQRNILSSVYIIDGIDETKKIAVEVNEPHHLYTKIFNKDKQKYDYLINKQGYSLVIIFDNVISKRKDRTKSIKRYVEYFSNLYEQKIEFVFFQFPDIKVLTNEGFSNFTATKKSNCSQYLHIKTNNFALKCTNEHKIFLKDNTYKEASELKIGDEISTIKGPDAIIDINVISENKDMYDIIETKDHTIYANDILVHQCLILDEFAFVDNNLVRDFWKSVYPIISSSKKSKIFAASTPNGTGNLFHELYDGAIKKENGWTPERVDWWEVPGRDENWKKATIRTLGSSEIFAQEFGNTFLQTGESAVDEVLFEKLKTNIIEPTYVYDDGKYLLWDSYKPDHLYAIGVDVAEGVGENASCIQVIDITDLTQIQQVAVYHNTNISPIQFIPKCHEIFQHWGCPPVLIERNNCGAQVVDQLKGEMYNYPNIISYGPSIAGSSYNRAGVLAHTNTKYKGITNMRYYTNDLMVVKIRDFKTLAELKGFVRHPNGTWSARSGELDDRVMALIWALIILENEIAEKIYEVEYDDNHRPLKLRALDYNLGKFFVDPTKFLINLKDMGGGECLPTVIRPESGGTYEDEDLETLRKDGWAPLNNNNT